MNCPSEQHLHHYHDGELAADEVATVRSHLQTCQACVDRLAELKIVSDLIKNAPMPQPAIEMMRRWQRLTQKTQEDSIRRVTGWLTAAASIVLAVSLHLALSNQAQATQSVSLAEWEPTAIGLQSDNGSSDQTTAQWIVRDLSRDASSTGEGK